MEQLRFCLSIMLGKASQNMLEIYRFMAKPENMSLFTSLKRTKEYSNDEATTWNYNSDTLRISEDNRYEKEKVFPLVMTASLIKNKMHA